MIRRKGAIALCIALGGLLSCSTLGRTGLMHGREVVPGLYSYTYHDISRLLMSEGYATDMYASWNLERNSTGSAVRIKVNPYDSGTLLSVSSNGAIEQRSMRGTRSYFDDNLDLVVWRVGNTICFHDGATLEVPKYSRLYVDPRRTLLLPDENYRGRRYDNDCLGV